MNNIVNNRHESSENVITSIFRRFCVWINARVKTQHGTLNDEPIKISDTNGRSGSDSGCETDSATNAHPVLIRTQKLHLDNISINEADDSNYVYIRNNKSGDNSPSIQHIISAQNSISNLNDLISDSNQNGKNYLTINTGESGSRQNLTVTRSAPSRSQRTSRVGDIVDCRMKPHHTWPLMRKILEQKGNVILYIQLFQFHTIPNRSYGYLLCECCRFWESVMYV